MPKLPSEITSSHNLVRHVLTVSDEMTPSKILSEVFEACRHFAERKGFPLEFSTENSIGNYFPSKKNLTSKKFLLLKNKEFIYISRSPQTTYVIITKHKFLYLKIKCAKLKTNHNIHKCFGSIGRSYKLIRIR